MIRANKRAALAAALALILGGCGAGDSPTADQPANATNAANNAAAAPASPIFPSARPLVPFVKSEAYCSWGMHAKGKEKWIRGDIGRGDENPMISFVDRVFDDWSDSDRHAIEVSVGDPNQRLAASAWSTEGGEAPGSAAFYMDAKMRQLIGGATSLQIWKDGKPVFNTTLANTPSAAELDACIQKPGWDVDSE